MRRVSHGGRSSPPAPAEGRTTAGSIWWSRLWRWLPVVLVLGLGLHLIVPQIAQLEQSMAVIRQMRWWALALAAAFQVLFYVGNAWHLQELLALTGDRISIPRGMTITLGAYSIGLVAGGTMGSAVATYRWLRCRGVSRQGALFCGWVPPIALTAGLTAMSAFGLVPLLMRHELTTLQLVTFLLGVSVFVVLIGLLLWGYHYRAALLYVFEQIERTLARLLHRPFDQRNIDRALNRFYGAWEALRAGAWRRPMLGIAVLILGDILTVYFAFLAAGYALPFGVLLAGYGLPLLLGRMALFLPGGVGVVEAAMAGLYTSQGAPRTTAVVAVLAYRAISFWIPVFLGFPVAVILEGKRKPGERGIASD